MAPGMANLVNKAMAQEKENATNASPSGTSPSRKNPAPKKEFPVVRKLPVGEGTSGAGKDSGSPSNKKASSSATVSPKRGVSSPNGASGLPSPQTSPSQQKTNTAGGNWANVDLGLETMTTDVTDAAEANWDKLMAGVKMANVVAKNAKAEKGRKLFQRDLVSAMTWEAFAPPPSNSVSGKFVPRVLNKYKNRRMFSIEVHRVTPLFDEGQDSGTRNGKDSPPRPSHSYEECVAR
jgi:hypothetical protein